MQVYQYIPKHKDSKKKIFVYSWPFDTKDKTKMNQIFNSVRLNYYYNVPYTGQCTN